MCYKAKLYVTLAKIIPVCSANIVFQVKPVRVTNKQICATECWYYKSETLCYIVTQKFVFVTPKVVLQKLRFVLLRSTKGSIHNTAEVGKGSDRPRFLRAL